MKRNRKINYETVMQIRISKELKSKVYHRSQELGKGISDYIRDLLEKDCKNIKDNNLDDNDKTI